MVVLRLVGDTWSYLDRLAVAIKPMEPFKGRLSDIQKALGLESFVGYAIYRTEGAHPHLIRPTVPIDVSSNLTKEKLAVGAQVVVYVKQADLGQQANDITFHKGLLHYRQEHGIKALAKDGSDVKAYIEDLSTRLNISDSTDIIEHEAEKRSKIEGEAHRVYWVLTSEFREIQALKDEESEAREKLTVLYKEGLSELYTVHVLAPRTRTAEGNARAKLQSERDECIADLVKQERAERPLPPSPPAVKEEESPQRPIEVPMMIASGGGGGMSKEDMEALVESMQALITANQQKASAILEHMQQEFNSVVDALAADMRSSAAEIKQLRVAVQGPQNDEKAATLAIEREVTGRLERERLKLAEAKAIFESDRAMDIQRWMGPRNEESAAVAKKLLAEQNAALRALIDEEDAMVEQQRVAMQSLAQGYELGLYSEALNAAAVEQSIQGMHLAQTHLALELEKVTEQLKRLEKERIDKEEAEMAAIQERAMRKARREASAKANRTITVVTNGYTIVDVRRDMWGLSASNSDGRGALYPLESNGCSEEEDDSYGDDDDDVEKAAGRRSPASSSSPTGCLFPEIHKMLLLFIVTNTTRGELEFMVRSRDSTTPAHLKGAHISRSRFIISAPTARSDDDDGQDSEALAEHYLRALISDCGGSPHALADAFVWTFSVKSHPYRDLFVRKLEECHLDQHIELDRHQPMQKGSQRERNRATPLSSAAVYGASVVGGGKRALPPAPVSVQPLDFLPYLDILLSLYEGREVELLLSMCPELLASAVYAYPTAPPRWLSATTEGCYNEDGSPTQHYYHSSVPEFSQWERPVAMTCE